MSLRLQGEIFRFPLKEYAAKRGIDISPRLISGVKFLWLSLANFHNEKTGQCNPSIKTLSKCIEKSASQTTICMNELKKLGLVSVSRNEKGGRFTPSYVIHLPSHPVDRALNTPVDNAPENVSETTHIVEANLAPYVQDATPIHCRTRILIETLDEPLIKSLVNEKNLFIKNTGLVGIAKKYGFQFKSNTPIHEVETWLLKAIKESIPHRITYEHH